ncbi:hypothetical protein BO99DRAFT_217424 [Aspergillus violaceofuscus CBS 115571]|uniref:Uncharacterized protein n=1 Tax=Aspergillus violaceofuscus (strain CBS 115571) TaxID=1450538 RepID=A0A2V5H3Q9_ASPV1|nr:hypothetical protein BO99DRAFT_217424 [Aspergillus violaceofuscus CBS 115571]
MEDGCWRDQQSPTRPVGRRCTAAPGALLTQPTNPESPPALLQGRSRVSFQLSDVPLCHCAIVPLCHCAIVPLPWPVANNELLSGPSSTEVARSTVRHCGWGWPSALSFSERSTIVDYLDLVRHGATSGPTGIETGNFSLPNP